MARLTSDGGMDRADVAPASPAPSDPRAVRVRLGAESRAGDATSLRIMPVPETLRMTNPAVGDGPLGGAAFAPAPVEAAGVLAQRHVLVDGELVDATIQPLGDGRYLLMEDGRRTRVVLEPERAGEGGSRAREALVDGFRFVVEVEPERIAALRERARQGRAASGHSGPLQVRAIIPGKVVAISVAAGDSVVAGQQLLVVEAMKMQNELRAPKDGTIERVGVVVGARIEIGDLLVVID
jgi:biotin carboxyl carrier protein